jgi:hypothetical protein
MKKWLYGILSFLLLIILVLSGILFRNIHNRHPGYKVDLSIKPSEPGQVMAGVSAVPVTPEIQDRWTDKNKDGMYDPEEGDSYQDLNHNGKFDAVWMAGFQNKRAANGIHDDLWARTLVISDGKTKIAIVALDAIGFMHDDVIDVRKMIPSDYGITYTIISSTHVHEGPDLMGLWGGSVYKSGVNPVYLQYVKNQIVKSVRMANETIQPVSLIFAENLHDAGNLVVDSRKPEVTDEGIRVIRILSRKSAETIGTLVAWANHPETTWSQNLMITSDFPNYVREGIEKGIFVRDSLVRKGLGGIAIYLNGCIGGLMTMNPETTVHDPWTGKDYREPSFEKAKSQGYQVAAIALNSINASGDSLLKTSIGLRAETFSLPLDNTLFRIGQSIRLFDRGLDGWYTVQSEVSAFSIGPATFITLPGEVYPEIVNGGIEIPAGADFPAGPVEVPPLRELVKNRYKFVLGLANDEVGYIIPQSEWDEKPPYLYNAEESPYGEINSLGPRTAPFLHREMSKLLKSFQE